jgi:hypothetical protein
MTIDLRIQEVAEHALRNVQGPTTRGAVVVMDVRTWRCAGASILTHLRSERIYPRNFR